jgi:acetyl esterase
LERYWSLYLDGADPDHPDASPLVADDHAGMPPTWVALAAFDPVRDDGVRYGAALEAAGVPVVVQIFGDMVHGFLRWAGPLDRSRELHAWLGAAARAALR